MNTETKQKLIEGLTLDSALLSGATAAVKARHNDVLRIAHADIANEIADAFFQLKIARTRSQSYKLIVALTLIIDEFHSTSDLFNIDEITSKMYEELFNNFAIETIAFNSDMTELRDLFTIISPITAMGIYTSTMNKYAE